MTPEERKKRNTQIQSESDKIIQGMQDAEEFRLDNIADAEQRLQGARRVQENIKKRMKEEGIPIETEEF